MTQDEIRIMLEQHKAWLDNPDKGQRAKLWNADLRNADLRHANLRDANLRDADLRHADLRHADLRHAGLCAANLWGADMWDADLRHADLWGANLRGADLWHADLRNADLRDADLRDADLRNANLLGCYGVTYCTVGQYQAILRPDGQVTIGCTTLTPGEWLDNSSKLIEQHELSTIEVAVLTAFLTALLGEES